MKKNYLEPKVEYVKLIVGPIMQIVQGSRFDGPGTGSGEAPDESPEIIGKNRGEWGNLWK